MKARFQLKNFRLSKNYTQQYMAERLSISRQQYCNMENGKTEKISADHKRKLSELLDVPEEQIDNTGIIYTKAQENGHNDQLIESIIEQNKKLAFLIQKLTDKLI